MIEQCGDDSPKSPRRAWWMRLRACAAESHGVRSERALHRGGRQRLIARAGAYPAPRLPQKRAVVITDENVAEIHLPRCSKPRGNRHRRPRCCAGRGSNEASRLRPGDRRLLAMAWNGAPRYSAGGGVVGDLAGFAAATTLRGLPLSEFLPLLARWHQRSGKTGINTRRQNLVGAFHQPRMCSPTPRHWPRCHANCAPATPEIAKAGLIGDAAVFRLVRGAWRDAA